MNIEMKKLYHRQKVLLSLLQTFGGKVANVDFQKYLFLFTQLGQKERSYEFVPYKFGCFSFQSYADRRKLTEFGILADTDVWELNSEEDFISTLKADEQNKLILFKDKFGSLTGHDLVKEVYRKYPYYATRSKIAAELMSSQELSQIRKAVPSNADYCFFTIGYEGRPFENYLNRLIQNNVRVLVDVRKNPISRKYGFSRSTLSETLAKLGIEYRHMPELGIVSNKRKKLENKEDYRILFEEYEATVLEEQTDALDALYEILIQRKRVAITCFEAEVCMCHRGKVAEAMEKRPDWKYEIQHI